MEGDGRIVHGRSVEEALRRREQDKVAERTKQRLAIAEEKHRTPVARLQADTERHRNKLEKQTREIEARHREVEEDIQRSLDERQERRRQHEEEVRCAAEAKSAAITRKMQDRQSQLSDSDRVDVDIQKASQAADVEVAAQASTAKAKLEELRRHRAKIEAAHQEELNNRSREVEEHERAMHDRGVSATLAAEVTRGHAAMAVERAGQQAERARANTRETRQKVEHKTAVEVANLERKTVEVQARCDAAIKERMRISAAELEAAKDYCKSVKAELAKETAQYKKAMAKLEDEANARAREVERRINELDTVRLEAFMESQRVTQQAQEQLRSRRDACDDDLEGVNRRLREIEEETKERARRILAQWVAGNQATEEAVRDLEKQGEESIAELKASVERHWQASRDRDGVLRERSTAEVARLEREANKVIDSTRPTLEAARKEDDEAAASAHAAWIDLRPTPDALVSDTDGKVADLMRRAEEKEAELERQAADYASAAKAATKAAREEEVWLIEETAAAWSRMREACYQLRLRNQHDLAATMSQGGYDLSSDEAAVLASRALAARRPPVKGLLVSGPERARACVAAYA